MFSKFYIALFCLGFGSVYSQNDSLKISIPENLRYQRALDPLSPSKAAFYSAVVPGMGQLYNKSYWKIPLVYGGMGAGIYFYIDNQRIYKNARNEYKLRLRGVEHTDTPKIGDYTADQLIVVQNSAQRNRDLSLFITIGLYVLNIVDANVDAHLQQFNVDEDLSFSPAFEYNPLTEQYQFGVNMSYRF